MLPSALSVIFHFLCKSSLPNSLFMAFLQFLRVSFDHNHEKVNSLCNCLDFQIFSTASKSLLRLNKIDVKITLRVEFVFNKATCLKLYKKTKPSIEVANYFLLNLSIFLLTETAFPDSSRSLIVSQQSKLELRKCQAKVYNVFKVKNRNTRITSIDTFHVLYFFI